VNQASGFGAHGRKAEAGAGRVIRDDYESDVASLHPNLPLAEFTHAINISLKHKYIWMENPKSACSTILLALRRLELGNADLSYINWGDIHAREYSPLLNARQVGTFSSFSKSKDVLKFCFVRDPYSRLVSTYLNKIEEDQPEKDIIVEKLGIAEKRSSVFISFGRFIDAIVEQDFIDMNKHWRPQYYQTAQEGINYDFIGKFENFERDIRTVGKRISDDFNSYIPATRYNSTESERVIGVLITPALKERIREKFALDFEAFGYDASRHLGNGHSIMPRGVECDLAQRPLNTNWRALRANPWTVAEDAGVRFHPNPPGKRHVRLRMDRILAPGRYRLAAEFRTRDKRCRPTRITLFVPGAAPPHQWFFDLDGHRADLIRWEIKNLEVDDWSDVVLEAAVDPASPDANHSGIGINKLSFTRL
jgi:hypothetical protein